MSDNFNGPRILSIDIETSPVVAHAWALFKQNIAINQIIEAPRTICFAAKWMHEKRVPFYSEFEHGPEAMFQAAHDLLDQADIVMHYNGNRFDLPRLNTEFIRRGMAPPAPYKSIDLLQVVRKQFGFQSNKLQWVAQELGLGGKVKHEGHELWIKCLAGDPKAWARMKRYNVQDVRLLEEVYAKVQPWITSHPHYGLYIGADECCPTCGNEDLERRGYALTSVGRFQRYRCKKCGSWSRSNRRYSGVTTTAVR